MAKIKDIAKKMNLSVSTVYKAFNGAADINEETRKNIYKTAQEMGYIPVGSHLKAEMKWVCVFLSHMERPHVTMFSYEIVLAFRREAMKYGYEVVIKELEDEKSLNLNQIVRDNKFDGCMVVGINTENFYYKQLETVDFPCVLIDNYVDNPCISCLSADNFLGMMLIADLLLKAGHEKIGFINGEYDSITSKERLASFVGELTRQNHHFDPSLVFNGDFSEQSGAEGAEELLKKGVSAICCASDSMAVGAIRRLGSLGVRVPEDVSITGFDDIQLADYIVPRLTTVHIDTNGMGARAFGCLLDIMEGGTGIKILEKPRLMERDSVASLM